MSETLRFRQSVALPRGGPLYHPGDRVEVDGRLVTADLAALYVAKGWAEIEKVITAPPMDKAVKAAPVQKAR